MNTPIETTPTTHPSAFDNTPLGTHHEDVTTVHREGPDGPTSEHAMTTYRGRIIATFSALLAFADRYITHTVDVAHASTVPPVVALNPLAGRPTPAMQISVAAKRTLIHDDGHLVQDRARLEDVTTYERTCASGWPISLPTNPIRGFTHSQIVDFLKGKTVIPVVPLVGEVDGFALEDDFAA